MSLQQIRTAAAAALGVCALAVSLTAQQPPPDNTKTNERDRQSGAVTADQQKENMQDRDLTKKIRQALTGDKSLSTYAHNVKVVTMNGKVTLKGPVRSQEEKNTVEAKAKAIAGAERVTSELSIAPASSAKSPSK